MKNTLKKLITQTDPQKMRLEEPLAKYTTLKIGGPADVLYITDDADDLENIVAKARNTNVPYTILGEGSNVLISDEGIRGLTIINTRGSMTIKGSSSKVYKDTKLSPRWNADKKQGTFKYEFSDLDYDESNLKHTKVEIDSGYSLPAAMYQLFNEGLTGLQWFSGIPGTIGGAIFNNIHGGTHFVCEYIDDVTILKRDGAVTTIQSDNLCTDYNTSIVQDSGDTILKATLSLPQGDVDRAKATAQEWAQRKSIQPRNSPGCAFANLTEEQKVKFGYPTTATGYIVEHVLKMTGFRIGDAAISDKHHNFIVNEGSATAKDYLAVMLEIHTRIKRELGICIRPEIFLLGFTKKETASLYEPS